jgi:tyrosine-protein kinase Etk/Wzc
MQEQQNTTTTVFNSNKSELWSLSLRDLFYKYVRFLPVFLLSVAICLFIAYVYLRYTTRIYSASGTMLIKNEQQPGARSDKFEDIFMNNKDLNIQSEIEVLKSRPLMERVVKKLNLQVSYQARGRFITNNIYKQSPFLLNIVELRDSFSTFSFNVHFINSSDFKINNDPAILGFGKLFKNQYGVFSLERIQGIVGKDYIITYKPLSAAAGSFVGGVQVTPKQIGTGILNISLQGSSPYMSADIVNGLMEEYDAYSIEQKNISADLSLDFIDDRLALIGHQLDSIQEVLLDFQQRNNMIDIDAQSGTYFQEMGEADRVINQQEIQMNIADMVSDYLKDKKNEYNRIVVPSSLGLEDATLNGLIAQYNKAQLDRKALINANIPEKNPAVLELDDQIEKLRISIQENIKNVKAGYNTLLSSARNRNTIAQGQIKELPVKTKKYIELKRQVEIKEGLYKILQEKREETAIGRASTISSSKIIDRAYASTVPIKPNRKAVRILAILLGLGLPAMFIFISEVLNDKISTRFDIEKITPAPILGEIGHSYSTNALIVTKTTRSMVAEQFRIIRSNLQYILNNAEKPVIMVTSSFSGEGKSFVTTNMGAVIALTGKKTIILEFDIRKPRVLAGLNMTKRPGITNFLVGKANLDELIVPVPEHENLFVLPCGPIPPNPSELLLGEKVTELFNYLKERFDTIITDTAPVGMVSDAQTLGKFANCTLYLVRQGHTFKKQVALIDEFYQDNKLPRISIVINDVKIKPGYGYYGYGRYGYGYGYGYGGYYDEEAPPQTLWDKVFGLIDIRRLFTRRVK